MQSDVVTDFPSASAVPHSTEQRSMPSDVVTDFPSASAVRHSTNERSKRKSFKKSRPARPCPFCGVFKVRLTRHLRAMHRTDEAVKTASKASASGKRSAFTLLRREGMKKYNMCHAGIRDAEILRERKSKRVRDDIVACGKCSGVFSKTYFWRHKRICCGKSSKVATAVDMKIVQNSLRSGNNVSEEFQSTILQKFLDDDVGRLCKSDEWLLMIGQKLYDKLRGKQDKKTEVRRSVMSDMRRLATLYTHFKEQMTFAGNNETQFVDMYKRSNFDQLEAAIRQHTAGDDESQVKAGLKLSLYYLVKRTAKIVKIVYLVREDDSTAASVDKFLDVFTINYNLLFGDALYQLNKKRQMKLRRPEELPPEQEVTKLRNYTVTRMQELVSDQYLHWTSQEYIELRDLVVSRLTLFNARRGNEPSRLRVRDWTDACNGVWISQSRVDKLSESEQSMFSDTKIMYETGKGNHLVPVIVLRDTFEALNILCDTEIRQYCDVSADNDYLFPSTQLSESHVSGWHATRRVCDAAEVPCKYITATKMRHLISTRYAALDVPECQRDVFYKHMGHSSAVNQNIYQAPPAETEILRVGAVLQQFDRGNILFCVSYLITSHQVEYKGQGL